MIMIRLLLNMLNIQYITNSRKKAEQYGLVICMYCHMSVKHKLTMNWRTGDSRRRRAGCSPSIGLLCGTRHPESPEMLLEGSRQRCLGDWN